MKSPEVVWHPQSVDRARREAGQGHRAGVVWFTGLSGSGKSTVAHAVEDLLFTRGVRSYVLDGDNVRHGLNGDLGFSDADRRENIRRIGEVARLFVDAGIIVLTAFISPFRADRQRVRELLDGDRFVEVFCDCSLETCASRDVKGLYARAMRGEISDFTGVSSPYEAPAAPELHLCTGEEDIATSAGRVLDALAARGMLPGRNGA